MAVNSRQKGARFERTLAAKFREYGYQCRRGQQFSAQNGDADVVGLPGIWVEAKHREQMRLYDWMEQAKRDSAGTGNLPVVFHKKNNHEILVTMQIDTFFELYREWQSGQELKEEQHG